MKTLPLSDRPSTTTSTGMIETEVEADRHIMLRDVAEKVNSFKAKNLFVI